MEHDEKGSEQAAQQIEEDAQVREMATVLHSSDDPEQRKAAAAFLGSAKTERKTETSRQNAKLGGRRPGQKLTDEHKRRISEGMRRRKSEQSQSGGNKTENN